MVVTYETNTTSAMEPPAPVAGAIARADVWIEFAVGYLMHSDAFRTAIDAGARYANLTGTCAARVPRGAARPAGHRSVDAGDAADVANAW